jgi:hypothetical protein
VALDRDQLVGALADQVGGPAQDPGPVTGGHPRPRPLLERLAGVAHGGVDVGRVGLHHRGEDLPVRRVDHVAAGAARTVARLAAHVEPAGREGLCRVAHVAVLFIRVPDEAAVCCGHRHAVNGQRRPTSEEP